MHIGESEITTLKLKRQLFMIDAHQMQHGRMNVMHRHRLLNRTVTKLIGVAMDPK